MSSRFNCLVSVTLALFTSCVSPQVGPYPVEECNCAWSSGKPSRDMSLVVTPPVTPVFPPSLNIPTNGDALDANTFKLGVEDPLQSGVEAARLMLYGGGIKRRVTCTSNTVMTIQPIGAVLALLAGLWTVVKNITINNLNPTALAGGVLTPSTRYWVYAQLTAGPTLGFYADTNPPEATLSYRNGDESSLWISTFYVNAAGTVLRYSQSDRTFDYYGLDVGNRFLNAGSATVVTPVAIGNSLPVQAMSAMIAAQWQSTVSCQVNVFYNDTSTFLDEEATATNFTSTAYGKWSAADGTFQLQYQVGNAAAKVSLFVSSFTI